MSSHHRREIVYETGTRVWMYAISKAKEHGDWSLSVVLFIQIAGFFWHETEQHTNPTTQRHGRLALCSLSSHRDTGSVLQRIFTNDSDAEMKMAMQRHKINSCKQQFMAITPRRFG
jgi:hypothetical protein